MFVEDTAEERMVGFTIDGQFWGTEKKQWNTAELSFFHLRPLFSLKAFIAKLDWPNHILEFGKFYFYEVIMVLLGFYFLTLLRTFCNLFRSKEFRASVENHHFFSKRKNLRGSTGWTIQIIIRAVRARKSKEFFEVLTAFGGCISHWVFRFRLLWEFLDWQFSCKKLFVLVPILKLCLAILFW